MYEPNPDPLVLAALEQVMPKDEAWYAANMCKELVGEQNAYGHKGWQAVQKAIRKLSKRVLRLSPK